MPAAITITARPPFRDLRGRFAKATEKMQEEKRDAMRVLGRRYLVLARDEAPKKTGKFAAGIRWQSFGSADRVGFRVTTPQPLGRWIIGGTKAHEITPKGPGYPLRFYWEKMGKWVATYRVWHPGTDPNPFTERALDRWMPDARGELNKIARDWAAEVAK